MTYAELFTACENAGLPYVGFSVTHCVDALERNANGAPVDGNGHTVILPSLADSDMHSPWIGSPSRIGSLNRSVPTASGMDI